MEDNFSMPLKDNIFFAKRLLVDAIYKSANLEGIAVTYAETNDILNDVNVEKVKPSDISKVFCMRDAWHFLLDHIEAPLHLGYIEEIHALIARADVDYWELGKIRTSPVLISGTSWIPEIPNPELLYQELQKILEIENVTDRALTIILWIMRTQMFRDGNKRVATMIGNKILIEHGKGLFSVPVELDGQFKSKLVRFYETNDMTEIKNWMYDTCLIGVNIEEP